MGNTAIGLDGGAIFIADFSQIQLNRGADVQFINNSGKYVLYTLLHTVCTYMYLRMCAYMVSNSHTQSDSVGRKNTSIIYSSVCLSLFPVYTLFTFPFLPLLLLHSCFLSPPFLPSSLSAVSVQVWWLRNHITSDLTLKLSPTVSVSFSLRIP